MNSKTASPDIILGVDSAMNGCGAAIYFVNDPSRSVSASVPMERGQAEALVPLVKDIVARADIAFSDIDLVVTTRGPGTFTGLRVGLSAARSFALALDVPLMAISTLEALARGYVDKGGQDFSGAVAVIIESKRSDYYFQLFNAEGGALCQPAALSAQEVLDAIKGYSGIIIGDAQVRFQEEVSKTSFSSFRFIKEEGDKPDPLILARLGSFAHGNEDYGDTSPLYLRGADVSQPKASPRKLEQ